MPERIRRPDEWEKFQKGILRSYLASFNLRAEQLPVADEYVASKMIDHIRQLRGEYPGLSAAILEVLRPMQGGANGSSIIEVGGFSLNKDEHSIISPYKENSQILTPIETTLCYTLMLEHQKYVTYEKLGNLVWGIFDPKTETSLKVHISHLRKKVGDYPTGIRQFAHFRNRHNVGYGFFANVDDQ